MFTKKPAEPDDKERHFLLTCGVEVTMQEHLDLLASPKKCNILGVDNTYERMVYQHQREWYGWPPMPDIDPKEEVWCGNDWGVETWKNSE